MMMVMVMVTEVMTVIMIMTKEKRPVERLLGCGGGWGRSGSRTHRIVAAEVAAHIVVIFAAVLSLGYG